MTEVSFILQTMLGKILEYLDCKDVSLSERCDELFFSAME